MDFTETAEYMLLCPTLLMGFEEQKRAVEVDCSKKRPLRVISSETKYRRNAKGGKTTAYFSAVSGVSQNTTLARAMYQNLRDSGSMLPNLSCSLEQDSIDCRSCPNQSSHHFSRSQCWQQCLQTASLPAIGNGSQHHQPRDINHHSRSRPDVGTVSRSVLDEIPIDRVTLSQEAKDTRNLMQNIQQMLMSSPQFEPTFHLEDIGRRIGRR